MICSGLNKECSSFCPHNKLHKYEMLCHSGKCQGKYVPCTSDIKAIRKYKLKKLNGEVYDN